MIEGVFHHTLDMRKVSHHPVLIEFLGLAIYGDNPVMSVQMLALALITQIQVMRSGDGECFLYVVHILLVFRVWCLEAIVLGGVGDAGIAQGFYSLLAGAALAAMLLAALVAAPGLGVVDT